MYNENTISEVQAVGFKKSDVITSSIQSKPPWLLARPVVNFTLHCSDKSNTSPEVFNHRFHELSREFKNYYRIFTDGSKEGNRVAAADNTKCVRLPDAASIFRAELYALLLAIDVVRRSKEKNFVIFLIPCQVCNLSTALILSQILFKSF